MKVFICLFFVLVSCSSPSKKKAEAPKEITYSDNLSTLKISALKDGVLSVDNHHFINLYFRNEGKDWLRVERVEIISVKGSANFKVLDDDDSEDLLEEMKLKITQQEKKQDERTLFHLNSYDIEKYLPEPFVLPGKLLVDRWVVFQIPKGEKLKEFKMEIELTDSTVKVYDIRPGKQR